MLRLSPPRLDMIGLFGEVEPEGVLPIGLPSGTGRHAGVERAQRWTGQRGLSVVRDGATSTEVPPRVFISFAHENDEHDDTVRDLRDLLRANGLDAVMDLTAAEIRQDWPLWMSEQLRLADYVLVIASPEYCRRAEGRAGPGEGWGVRYEAASLREKLYAEWEKWFHRVLPVLLPGYVPEDIPDWMGRYSSTHYSVPTLDDAGIERLLRVLFKQPWETEPPIGPRPHLPPRPLTTAPSDAQRPPSAAAAVAPADSVVAPAGSVDISLSEEDRRVLLRELAEVFSEQDMMDYVLDRVGLPRMRQVRSGTSMSQWTSNLREMTNGAIFAPYRKVLRAALDEMPANPVFAKLAVKYRLSS